VSTATVAGPVRGESGRRETVPEDVGRVERHRFAGDVQREILSLATLDNWHGPLALATDWAIVVGVVLLCESLSGWVAWACYLLVALPVIGTRQRALATLLHESAHGTLAKSKRLNKLLGTWLSGWLIFQSYETYRRSHVRDHHGSFGDAGVDPDLRAHIDAGLYAPHSGARFAWRYLIQPLLGRQTPSIIKELVSARLSGTKAEVRRGLGVVLYMAAIAVAFAFAGAFTEFVLYWLVPLLVVFPMVNWYIELLEHFPLVGNDDLDVKTTRHRALGPISRHLVGIHNEGYHLDHHLNARIPFWNLPRAHELRLRDPRFAEAVAETAPAGKSVLWQYFDMVRRVDEGRVRARLDRLPKPDGVDGAH
jgi:fatty acid desaturase